jgi:tetratricopeptide (TPR) repeat protein
MKKISKILSKKYFFLRLWSFLILLTLLPLTSTAQSSAVKKAAKSMFKLTTFDANGNLLHTGYGAFVDANGTCLATWEAFIGASKANIIDAQGRKYDVDCLIGANEIYNVSKFKVVVPEEKKMAITPIAIAQTKIEAGSDSWLIEYDIKNPVIKKYQPSKVESFQNNLPYYIYEQTASDELAGSPFLNTNGELLGLMQPAKKRTDIYCPSAQYAMSMTVSGFTSKQATMRLTQMRVALPDDFDQAVVALFMNQGNNANDNILGMADEFISKFPTASEGYNSKALYLTDKGKFAEAAQVMEEGIEKCEKKDEPHFDYSKLIFNKLLYSTDSTFTDWTLDKAIAEVDAAMGVNPLPVYNLHKGKILYTAKRYDEAYNIFLDVTKTNMRSAECFYNASLCLQANNAPKEKVVEMLDSAVACFPQPYKADAAPYLMIRGKYLDDNGMYRKAAADYSEYEKLMGQMLNGKFFYLKEQAELKAKLYQPALDDIDKAITLAPNEQLYYAEKAMLQVRVNKIDEGMATAQLCMTRFPDYGDAHAVYGLAQILKGKKKEGLTTLEKAKELGSEMAEPLMEKYSK